MSYKPIHAWRRKDSLPPKNPDGTRNEQKILKGAELQDEFDAISKGVGALEGQIEEIQEEIGSGGGSGGGNPQPLPDGNDSRISDDQIVNWDEAYGWGDHSAVGYLTSEEDPTVPNHVKAITEQDIQKWDAGSGGGDGYDDTQIREDLAKEVEDRKDGDQLLQDQIDNLGSGGGSGGGSNTITATALGAISAGDLVVSSGEEVVSSVVSQPVDGEFKSLSDWGESGSALPNLIYSKSKNRLVLFYKNSDQRGVAIVGKIEGDTVSFGTPVIFQSSVVDFLVAIECEDIDRFAVLTSYSSTGKAYVAAVDDMSIRFGGSPANAGLPVQGICYDQKNQAVVVGGKGTSSRVRCESWRFNLSDSGIDGDVLEEIRGYDVSDNAVQAVRLTLCNRTGNVLFLYSETSGRGVARAVSFENLNSPQKGSEKTFASSISDKDIDCSYHDAEGVVVVNYRDSGYDASAIVAKLDGLEIEFGQPAEVLTVLGSRQTDEMRSVYDPGTNNVLFMYRNRNLDYHCYGINGKVDGLSISFDSDDSAYVLVSNSANSYSPVYVGSDASPLTFASHIYTSSKRHVMLFSNSYEETNLSETNYIGISSSDALDGEDVTVDISGGVNTYQKDLLFGERYYVSHNGDLTASTVTSPLYPEVLAGTAISSQKIIVKG